MHKIIAILGVLFLSAQGYAQETTERQQTPMMGWASWNNFRTGISESIIKTQADAFVGKGLKDAGYTFINVDDGYFGGRDKAGNILVNPARFPGGMKAIADYIHAKGLKAGLYSDAGINTCGSWWDKDTIGVGMGLYGHERQDLTLFLKNWGFDFIKVDWCGGEWLKLDEETRYTYISHLIREIAPRALYNVCRWQFPGKWVCNIADSWRISGDIANNFQSLLNIIDKNADLWKYAGPGHVNDMDMLQVGRGMSYEEDKTHFSMWAMLCSPLLAGNDLTTMSPETIRILTNKEMIAIDQDPLVYQARRLVDVGDQEVWARPLHSTISGEIAVALLNRSSTAAHITFSLDTVGIDATKGYTMHDVWSKKDYPTSRSPENSFEVPPHGVVVLTIHGVSKPYNVFQFADGPPKS
jgi:alpha-galactosidase